MASTTASDKIAEQRTKQEERSTELMLEQSNIQDQLTEKKKAYKKAVAEGNVEEAKAIRDQIEGLAKKNRAYKDELKILGMIGSQLDDNVDVMDKESLLAYDIVGAEKNRAKIAKQIGLLKQKLSKATGEEKKEIEKLLNDLNAQAGLADEITDKTIQAASEAQTLNKAFDSLLGTVGQSVDGLSKMGDQAGIIKKAMFSVNGIAIAIVATLAVMIQYQIETVKQSLELSKNLGIGYQEALKLKDAFDDSRFSLGFFLKQAKKIPSALKESIDFEDGKLFGEAGESIAKSFGDAITNYMLDIDLSASLLAIKTEFKSLTNVIEDSPEAMKEAAQVLGREAVSLATDAETLAGATRALMMVDPDATFGGSITALKEAADAVSEMGVAKGDFMKDLASDAADVAAFTHDGMTNIINASVAARKMGVEMTTLTKIARSLLDFESSIEAEMQASLMIGKQLNFDQARQLALQGDIAGAARNVVDQIGGVGELMNMNVLQRDSLAASIGVDTDELMRMVTGRKKQSPEEKAKQESMKIAVDSNKATMDNTVAIQKLTEAFMSKEGIGGDVKDRAIDMAIKTGIGGGLIYAFRKKIPGLNKLFKGKDVVDGVKDASKVQKIVKNAAPSAKELASQGLDRYGNKMTKAAGSEIAEKVGKKVKQEVAGEVTEKIAKELAKQGSKTGVGFLAKQIPVIGAIPSLVMAGFRAVQGDSVGAGMELSSAVAELANLTGVGTGTGSAVSFGIDAAILARDVMRAKDVALQEMKLDEFEDLTEDQRAQVKMASLPGKYGEKTTQEIIDNLKIMTDTNEQQMAEFLEVLQAIAGNTQQTATNVERVPGQLTNN